MSATLIYANPAVMEAKIVSMIVDISMLDKAEDEWLIVVRTSIGIDPSSRHLSSKGTIIPLNHPASVSNPTVKKEGKV